MLTPIKIIKGLHTAYRHKDTVTHTAYNDNIKVLQQAIEYNGEVLDEAQGAIKDLIVDKLPDGSVTTELILDEAVTEDKLTKDIQDNKLVSHNALADYFGDIIPELHRNIPELSGAFLNGSVTSVKKVLATPLNCEVSIVHNRDICFVEDEDSVKWPAVNAAVPETFAVDMQDYELPGRIWDAYYGWIMTIDLKNSYKLGETGDSFNLKLDYCYRFGSTAASGGDVHNAEITKFVLKNAQNQTIATIKPSETAFFKKNSVKWKDRNNWPWYTDTYSLNANGKVYDKVRFIEVFIEVEEHTYGRGSWTWKDSNTDWFKLTPAYPKTDINLTKLSTGAAPGENNFAEMQYTSTLSAPGSRQGLTLGAHLSTTSAVTFADALLTLSVHAIGNIPPDLHTSQDFGDIAAITGYFPAQLTTVSSSEDRLSHFVKWDFTPPLIVTGTTSTGTYSWIKYKDAFIYPDTVDALVEAYGLTDVICTPFEVGSELINITLVTTQIDTTVESISTARHRVKI